MPILRSLFGSRAVKSTDFPWDTIFEPAEAATGKRVTPHDSLRVATVYAAVRLLAESVSSLPASLILREGSRRTNQDGPLADLLTVEPNPEQDAPELWRSVMGWMLLEGNAYVYVERDTAGAPVALWPLPTTGVSVGRTPGAKRLYYNVSLAGDDPDLGFNVARLGPENVLHYKAFGTGLYGLSPLRQVREAVATSLAAQEYMGRFYKQDASPGGVIQVPGDLTDEQFDRLNKQWKEAHQGVKRSHMMAILEAGATWQKVGLNPGDAAFIETQKWETVEIARAFGVPPHMIGDVERSTSWGSGIAEQGIGFVTYTLTPWITRLEWVARRGLLGDLDPRLRLKFRVDGLQRGDTKSRYDGYAIGKQWGFLSTNDIRTLEDMDPVEGGDAYLQPLNMVPASTSSTSEPNPQPERPVRALPRRRSTAARRRIAEAFAPLIADADERIAKIERQEVERLVRTHLDEGGTASTFMRAVEELYGSTIRDRARDRFAPVFATLVTEVASDAADEAGADAPNLETWVAAYTASRVADHTARSIAKLRGDTATENPAAAVRTRLDGYVNDRPAKTGRWESTRLSRAAAREAWRDAGVREIVWVASGADTCPLCQDLNGKVVGIEQPFVAAGDKLPGGEGQEDLEAQRNRFHPPIHPGCDCDIAVS